MKRSSGYQQLLFLMASDLVTACRYIKRGKILFMCIRERTQG